MYAGLLQFPPHLSLLIGTGCMVPEVVW